ncbi:phospholipase D-like domain-containing protein [Gemmatimonas sp.]|uniref:phospholipase D-like domain-containing protein n=1 Tax=Gemmatimonas sp. TaxID=1962908 RepID=UPI003DA583C9
MTVVDALAQVCDGGHVHLVAPYISPARLEAVITQSDRVSVITDLTECFRALSAPDRNALVKLIADREGAFRHLPNVHAKVVFSRSRMLVGSANLTNMGLETRDELGVLFHEATQLAEARVWFKALWDRGAPVDADSLRAWVASLPVYQPIDLPEFEKRVGKKKVTVAPAQTPPREAKELDAVLRLAPSRAILQRYLGIINWAYGELGVPEDDPRLVVSIPKTNHIYLSINNRWVLQHSDDFSVIGILLPSATASRLARRKEHVSTWQFDERRDGEVPPCLFRTRGYDLLNEPQVLTEFAKAMRTELQYGRRASNRRFHRADLLALILDPKQLQRHLRAIGMS